MELHSTTLYTTTALQNISSGSGKAGAPKNDPNESSASQPVDRITLSEEGKEKSSSPGNVDKTAASSPETDEQGLSTQDLTQLRTLKQRDTEVRSHEQAHLSAAGQYARGGASFVFQKGPDGASYAVGGEVGIDVSREATPEDTISKMQTIKRAALAPLNPSSADRSIAAQASIKESLARQEIIQQQHEDLVAPSAEANAQNPEFVAGDSYSKLTAPKSGFEITA